MREHDDDARRLVRVAARPLGGVSARLLELGARGRALGRLALDPPAGHALDVGDDGAGGL